jgi:hypothetical protein
VEPIVSLDLDLAVATADVTTADNLLQKHFRVERFPHSVNVSIPGSDLQMQLQTDPRYGAFIKNASERDVLNLRIPVAKLEDVLQKKIWATQDSAPRPSKRQKNLTNISRLLETHPELRSRVPENVLFRLI